MVKRIYENVLVQNFFDISWLYNKDMVIETLLELIYCLV